MFKRLFYKLLLILQGCRNMWGYLIPKQTIDSSSSVLSTALGYSSPEFQTTWRGQGLNPGHSICKEDALPLHYYFPCILCLSIGPDLCLSLFLKPGSFALDLLFAPDYFVVPWLLVSGSPQTVGHCPALTPMKVIQAQKAALCWIILLHLTQNCLFLLVAIPRGFIHHLLSNYPNRRYPGLELGCFAFKAGSLLLSYGPS